MLHYSEKNEWEVSLSQMQVGARCSRQEKLFLCSVFPQRNTCYRAKLLYRQAMLRQASGAFGDAETPCFLGSGV
jgi:hypothetical protein